MTSDQYRTAIERLGLTQAQAAEYLGVSVRTSHGYANGAPIPQMAVMLLKITLRVQKRFRKTYAEVLNELSQPHQAD